MQPHYPIDRRASPQASLAAGEEMAMALTTITPIFADLADARLPRIRKADTSIVTETDLRVQHLLHVELGRRFPGVPILAEENVVDSEDAARAFFQANQVLVIDPIDGTANFANGFPLYGVSVGLLSNRNGKLTPSDGAVYLPALRKLYFTKEGSIVSLDTSLGSSTAIPVPATNDLSADDIIFLNLSFYSHFQSSKLAWSPTAPLPRTTCSTVVDMLYTGMGVGVGTVTAGRLWDIAGVLPIADRLHRRFFDLGTLEPITEFGVGDFFFGQGLPWQLKKPCLLCAVEHASALQKLLHYQPIDFSALLAQYKTTP